MKKLFLRFAPVIASLALVIATVGANTTCSWVGYQDELPDRAKKLRKF